jgi:hypothetical protein
VNEGQSKRVVRKETYEDLLRNDILEEYKLWSF